MPIEVTTTDQNVEVSTSGQTVNATVSGGVGPAGPAGVGSLEYANLAAFPATGTAAVIYVARDTNRLYRWTGTAYVELSAELAHAATHASGGADPITVAQSQVTGLTASLSTLAPKASPEFTTSGGPATFSSDNGLTTEITGDSITTPAIAFSAFGQTFPTNRQQYPYTTTERTKLAGIATGATANATDAQLRDRSTHTGTQALSTLSQSGATTSQVAQWNGTAWVAATISTAPSGAAGGDLTGTYPNPQIAAGAVTEADLANAVRVQMLHPFLLAGM